MASTTISTNYAKSTESFKSFIAELGLDHLWKKFQDAGFESFLDFAFCIPDPANRITEFEAKVVPTLLNL